MTKHLFHLTPIALCIAATALISGCANTGVKGDVQQQVDQATDVSTHVIPKDFSLLDSAKPGYSGSAEAADKAAKDRKTEIIGRRSARPFIGSTMVPVTSEDKLPALFREDQVLNFSDARDLSKGQGVSLQVAMSRLSRMTGVAVRIEPDVYSGAQLPSSSSGSVALHAQIVPGQAIPSPLGGNSLGLAGLPVASASTGMAGVATPATQVSGTAASAAAPLTLDAVEMNYHGSLQDYLTMVTDRLGLAWDFRDNTIVISRFVTNMYEIYSFDSQTDGSMSTSGSGGGAAGSSGGTSTSAASTLNVNEKVRSDMLASIEATLNKMVKDVQGSDVVRSEGSGRYFVKTSKEAQGRVRDYIKSENKALRRMAQVQFDIYTVTTDISDQRGVNWSGILNDLSKSIGVTLSAPATLTSTLAASAQVNVLPNIFNSKLSNLFGGTNAIVAAMTERGYNVAHKPVSLMMMNRRWARLNDLNSQGYVSETVPGVATTTGAGAPGLKTSTITTGDQFVAMPQIMDDNTVMLNFGVSLSDLVSLLNVSSGTGSSQQTVQVPNTAAVNAQFPIAIRPGDVVAVTGLSRVTSTADTRSLGESISWVVGGSRTVELKRENIMILIRALIM
jgi:type IVB pilus formation R64 PilN family outer membrane protein